VTKSLAKLENLAAPEPYALVGGPFGSKLISTDYVDEGIPVIRGSNLNGGRYLKEDDFVYVSEQKMREDLFGNLAHPGDIVFTQRGTLGQVALIPDNSRFDTYVISQSQMKLTVDKDKADVRFIYYFFRAERQFGRF
jgi:type I restriction enzyme S subunit